MPDTRIKNEKSLNKYTDLMKSINNIQEKKVKVENECKKAGATAKPPQKLNKKLLPSSFNKNISSYNSRKPSFNSKQNASQVVNPIRTILKNSRSNENVKKSENVNTNPKKLDTSRDLRSRSAEFVTNSRRSINNSKTINWNDLQNLINLHFSSHKTQVSPSIQQELESKLNEMKREIDDLKSKLTSQNYEIIDQKNEGTLKTTTMDSINTDLSQGLNFLITNYSEKLAKINHQIVNLKRPEIIYHPKQQFENKVIPCNNHKEIHVSPKTQEYVNQLELELKNCRDKCKLLESSLEAKTKQVEQYHGLFKEISENVNSLIQELEVKDDKNNQFQPSVSVNITETKSITNLMRNLAKFEKALKGEKESERPKEHQTFKKSKDCSHTDTLVDADSSFADFADSLKRPNFNSHDFNQQLKFNKLIFDPKLLNTFEQHRCSAFQKINSVRNENFVNQASKVMGVRTSLKNQFDEYFDDEDDDDKIVFSMDDLSITTIQTSNNTTESVESILNLKNVQDDDFQKDLNVLDEKILKVKKMIDSMKNS